MPRPPAAVRRPLPDIEAGGGPLMGEMQPVTVGPAGAERVTAGTGLAVAAGRAKDDPRAELGLRLHPRPRAFHAPPPLGRARADHGPPAGPCCLRAPGTAPA